MKLEQFAGYLRRCADDYNMLCPGDSVVVGLSGGKDSMALLAGLEHLRVYHPSNFRLSAVTIDMGFADMDFSCLSEWCRDKGIDHRVVKTDLREIVFDIRREENPCSLCSKMRRGALNDAVREMGGNKIALGHHFDDAVETFLISLLFEGRINCFKPVTYMSRAKVTQIRPMLYVGEAGVRSFAESMNLPVVTNTCPEDKESKRAEIKNLISRLSLEYPDLKSKVFGAMQRLPLEGWGTAGGR